jgi:hypothetical protein
MAESTSTINPKAAGSGKNWVTSTSVDAAGNTTLVTMNVSKVDDLSITAANTVQALDNFVVQASNNDSDYVTRLTTSDDFTAASLSSMCRWASEDPNSLAAGATLGLELDVSRWKFIKVLASAAVDSSVVSLVAYGKGV